MVHSQRLRDLEERLSGLNSDRVAGLQQVYFVAGSGLVLAALLASISIDVLRGDMAGALRVGGLVLLLAVVIAKGPRPHSNPRGLYRVLLISGLALITYEACLGTNEGFSFLWFYVFPIPFYFLLGGREARVWIAVLASILAWLLLGPLPGLFPGGHPGIIALISLVLLGLLAHGMEATREGLVHSLREEAEALEQARQDVLDVHGLIPVCVRCQGRRDDPAYRARVASYLSRHPPAELTPALCPACAAGVHGTPASSPVETAAFRLRDLWNLSHGARHGRRRRVYFALGMLGVLPLLVHLFASDLLAGNLIGAGITFLLVIVFGAVLMVLQRGRYDPWIYQLGLAAIFLTLGYDLYAGSFDGFAPLWLYAMPILTLLVSGTTGVVWTLADFLGCVVFLLLPIGHAYPTDFVWRFFATFSLTSVMAFWLERLRQRTQSNLESERLALRQTLDEVQGLRALLPICPACRTERNDPEFWQRVEGAMSEASSARFRRGLCSVCESKGVDA